MRVRSSRRSAAVNFQLNGLAVRLWRCTKASRVAERSSRLAKSLGETTFFWTMEKKIILSLAVCGRADLGGCVEDGDLDASAARSGGRAYGV